MATLLEARAARGQRWAAVPALGGRANGAATRGQPSEHGEREGSKVSGAASWRQVTVARTARERQRQPAVQRAGDRRRAAAVRAQRRERRRLLATRPATLKISRARAQRVYAGELGRARAAAGAEKEEARRVTEGRMWEAAGRRRGPGEGASGRRQGGLRGEPTGTHRAQEHQAQATGRPTLGAARQGHRRDHETLAVFGDQARTGEPVQVAVRELLIEMRSDDAVRPQQSQLLERILAMNAL